MGRVEDIADMPIGCNAIIVEDVKDKTLPRCQDDIFSRIELRVKVTLELIPSIVLSSKRLITRMTFNSFLSCLMSKVSIEITINTSKWHEHAKQWNGNSHISS